MKIKSLFKNSFFSLLSQLILLLFGFLSQRAMNLYLGTELVGMNGVISNVIAMLSVTELGISTAIVYHLYSALVNKDEQGIAALMNLYRKAYLLTANESIRLRLRSRGSRQSRPYGPCASFSSPRRGRRTA